MGPNGAMPPVGMPLPPQMVAGLHLVGANENTEMRTEYDTRLPNQPKAPFQVSAPHASGPGILPPGMEVGGEERHSQEFNDISEPTRNFARPAISDDLRGNSPRKAKRTRTGGIRKRTEFEIDPSSYGSRKRMTESQVEAAIRRREAQANPPLVIDLINDPGFWDRSGLGGWMNQVRAAFGDIQHGRDDDETREAMGVLEDALRQYENDTGVRPLW